MKTTTHSPTTSRWDWYLVGLMLLMAYLAAGRLSMTNWTSELGYVETVAVPGTLVGLMLASSRLRDRTVGWVALGLTAIAIPWQMANVVNKSGGLAGILNEEWARLVVALQQFTAREPIYDPIFFVTLVTALYWWVGVYSGYRIIRRTNLLAVLLPTTVPILIVQYYDGGDPARIWVVGAYFLLALLLIGRMNILRSREKWESERVLGASESAFDLGSSILISASAVILAAWLLPTPGAAIPAAARFWQQLNEPYQALHQWINNTLDAVRGGSIGGSEPYGNSLELGVRASQGPQTVFRVRPPRSPDAASGATDFPRFYWQMRIYDTYADGEWSNGHQNWSRPFSPDEGDLPVPGDTSTRTTSFDFIWEGSLSTLMAGPPQPVWASLGGSIQYENAQLPQIDITSWHTHPFLQAGDEYRVRAQLLNPRPSLLRSAGTDYPAWVTGRYLRLPSNFSSDIRILAEVLTRELPTVYDKASALTDYLRSEITYSPSIAPPPPDTDPLEWFLFTWKSGYCNYYASAEVLMLRSVGIPARMAVGYAEGTREDDGSFTVRERDAHAWPQVYFPSVGWVNFEPTASQPPLERPAESENPDDPSAPAGQPPAIPTPSSPQGGENSPGANLVIQYQTIRVWVIIFAVVFAAGYGIWFIDRKKAIGRRIPQFIRSLYLHHGLSIPAWLEHWERSSNSTLVERSFDAINQSLAWLGKPQPPHATPAERAAELKNLMPGSIEEIERLKKEHEKTLFSPTPGDPAKAVHAAWMIRYHTARALLRRFLGVKNE